MNISQEPLKDILYCGVCTLPPEYCEFNTSLKKCKEWLQKEHPDEFEKLYVDTVATGIANVGLTPAVKPKDASEKLEKKLEAEAEKKRNTKVLLKCEKRRGKKIVTVITGLDVFGVDLKKASKLFSQKFATGSSITKNVEGKEEVVIQGEVADEAAQLIAANFPQVPKDNIQTKS